MDTLSREMPKYKCFKEVWALKIKEIDGIKLVFEDSGYAPIETDQEWFNKHRPEAGGYLVVYKDGYKSYSPAAAFEGGYELIPEGDVQEQETLRYHLDVVLQLLRKRQAAAGQSPVGRAVSIAITDFEKVCMVIIRSFFADKPYSPLQKLQPAQPKQ